MAIIERLREAKILGLPALYVIAVLVAVGAWFAWRMVPSAAPVETDEAGDLADEAGDVYPTLSPYTVVATNTGAIVETPPEDPNKISDNDEWFRAAVNFLVARGKGATAAQKAVSAYLDGADLSYTEGVWLNAVIKEGPGLPPYPGPIGNVAPKPKPAPTPTAAQPRPANTPPPAAPKRTYTVVKGDNLTKIGRRYGLTWQTIYNANRDKIKNPNLIYPGQVLTIP